MVESTLQQVMVAVSVTVSLGKLMLVATVLWPPSILQFSFACGYTPDNHVRLVASLRRRVVPCHVVSCCVMK